MHVFESLGQIPRSYGPTVVSIGNFDGVHRGHKLILDAMRRSAAARSMKSVAVTFDPHPLGVLRPEGRPKLITPLDTRLELLEAAGVDAVFVLRFTEELSKMRAGEFVRLILHDSLRAAEVHEGPNFRFGYRAEGEAAQLTELGRALGFTVVIHPVCHIRGFAVSSSKIRDRIARGDMRTARLLLGYSFFIRSAPAAGRGIGAALTVPTINLAPYTELLPPNGVYVTEMSIDGEWFDAVTNIGNRPTMGQPSFAVESHLLNFRPVDLAATTPLKLVFHRRLREERLWPSPEALKTQILKDVESARRYLHLKRLFENRFEAGC